MNRLSLRLGKIASLVPLGARVCDIGTDHGYLAIELMRSGKAKRVIAADINSAPLENAHKNIEKSQVQGIELRLCDGFEGIEQDEFDTAIIAGMGGEVIAGILKRAREKLKNGKTLLLQPTTSPEALRQFLYSNGFEITEELPVYENGKLYSVMRASFSGSSEHLEDYRFFIGKITPETEEGLLYLKKQQNRCFKCMKALENNENKISEYEYYKALYSEITNYINSFTEN